MPPASRCASGKHVCILNGPGASFHTSRIEPTIEVPVSECKSYWFSFSSVQRGVSPSKSSLILSAEQLWPEKGKFLTDGHREEVLSRVSAKESGRPHLLNTQQHRRPHISGQQPLSPFGHPGRLPNVPHHLARHPTWRDTEHFLLQCLRK
jgi:hypothetical protein